MCFFTPCPSCTQTKQKRGGTKQNSQKSTLKFMIAPRKFACILSAKTQLIAPLKSLLNHFAPLIKFT